ncbi:hypothetical protein [Pseudomonas putida]|uniref:hypothetical protein n=1 Tax=Pseudomonas putida TaxID=303 RepID=UPI000A6845F9|nr:hypothetical protein [Pseudomonas putida]
MKSRLTWIGTLSAFAVFGWMLLNKLEFGENFYKVESIHDLFEIFGAAATIVAVVMAAVSLGSWRKQAKASIDHEIARELIVNLNRFRDLIMIGWSHAEDYIGWRSQHLFYLSEEGRTANIYESLLKEIRQARAEIETTILEAKVLWTDFFPLEIYDLYKVQMNCCFIIERGIRDSMRGYQGKPSDSSDSYDENLWEELVEIGMTDYRSGRQCLDKFMEPILVQARKRLLRS